LEVESRTKGFSAGIRKKILHIDHVIELELMTLNGLPSSDEASLSSATFSKKVFVRIAKSFGWTRQRRISPAYFYALFIYIV